MNAKIKGAIEKSINSIDDIDDIFEDLLDDLPEKSKDVQARSRAVLRKVQSRLKQSLKDSDSNVDEARLQAHLGLMEAQDKLEQSGPIVEDMIEEMRDKGLQLMDEAQLKGHLALMEAEDYWERDGKDLAKKFGDSSDDMAALAGKAIDKLQSRLGSWTQTMRDANTARKNS